MVFIELLKCFKWYFVNKYNKRYLHFTAKEFEHRLSKIFFKKFGYAPDFQNPKGFNEKIQWLKLYDNTPLKGILADKFSVRAWVKEKIGEEYLIPLLGVYDKFEDIDFSNLPDKFVLKTNHASSTNVLVKDKKKLNLLETKLKFRRWLSTNYAFKMGFELHYGLIKPKIVYEKFMGNGDLIDYKFFCFMGGVKFVWVDTGRYTNHKRNLYDLNWNEMEFTYDKYEKTDVLRPKNLEKMIEFARKLSTGFSFVRVDFYEIDGHLYFGEMTFTSSSGMDKFYPEKYDQIVGSYLQLPKKSPLPLSEIAKIWG